MTHDHRMTQQTLSVFPTQLQVMPMEATGVCMQTIQTVSAPAA